MSRTRFALVNSLTAVGGQILFLLIGFVTRGVFVRSLPDAYLGINGLFANLLNMLSLVELGVGSAIIYSLYRPIASQDTEQINQLAHLYRRIYTFIALAVLLLGLGLLPFLPFFFREAPDMPGLRLYFILYLANTVASYIYIWKRSLIIAHQKRYVTTLVHIVFFVVRNCAQIAVLLWLQSFVTFLLLQIAATILENVVISRQANRLFPYIRQKPAGKPTKASLQEIKRNTTAMLFHRFGSVLVNGTDNLILAKFVGLVSVGLYSNYALITQTLNSLFGLIFQSLTASVGNLGVEEDADRSAFIFDCLHLLAFWLYGFAAICLLVLVNPFIRLWLGQAYLLSPLLILVVTVNFLLSGLRRPILTCRDALGLYWHDRYKPIAEALLNLLSSILLVRRLGAVGVFLGTTISLLLTCFWIEPLVLFRHGYRRSSLPYFGRQVFYLLLLPLAGLPTWLLSRQLPSDGIPAFLLQLTLCLTLPNLLFWIFLHRRPTYRYMLESVKRVVRQQLRRSP